MAWLTVEILERDNNENERRLEGGMRDEHVINVRNLVIGGGIRVLFGSFQEKNTKK